MIATILMPHISMLTTPLPKLVRSIAIPVSIGFFFNTMYNVIDLLFASSINGTEAQAALTATFPIFLGIISIAS